MRSGVFLSLSMMREMQPVQRLIAASCALRPLVKSEHSVVFFLLILWSVACQTKNANTCSVTLKASTHLRKELLSIKKVSWQERQTSVFKNAHYRITSSLKYQWFFTVIMSCGSLFIFLLPNLQYWQMTMNHSIVVGFQTFPSPLIALISLRKFFRPQMYILF